MENFDLAITVEVIDNVAKIVSCDIVPKKQKKPKPPRVVEFTRNMSELQLPKKNR